MSAAGPLLAVVGILLGARAAGRRLVAGPAGSLHPATAEALQTAIGLLLVSYVVMAMALLGAAGSPELVVVWALLSLAGVAELVLARGGGDGPTPATPPAGGNGDRSWHVLGLLIAAWCTWAVAASTLPPTAIDELVYQLEIPRRTLELGSLPSFADNIYGYFPQAGGMLFTLGMAIAGPAAAKLLHAAAGLLTALALYGAARRLAPEAPAWIGVAVFLGAPTVLVLGAWAYVDLFFTLFLFLALVCTLEMLGPEPHPRWALLAGVLAGGAWAVKYTGLQASLLLALILLLDRLRHRDQGGFPWPAILLPGMALAVASPWLVRNWWTTGWPLYPFPVPGLELVPGMNWDPGRAELYVRWLSQYGGGPERGLAHKLLSPLSVFVTARFDGAFDGMAGPVFLLAPLLWIGRRPGRRLTALWLFVGAYLLYWTFTTTQVRFLVPVLAPLALLLAAGLGSPGRRWARPLAVVLLAAGVGFAAFEVASWSPGRYWLGIDDRDAWVERRVPAASVYRASEALLSPDDTLYLVNMRHFGYLLQRPPAYLNRPGEAGWRSDYVFQHYRLGEALATGSPAAVDELFRGMGVTHVLLDEQLTLGALAEPERRLLAEYLRRRGRRQVPDPEAPHQSLWRLQLPPLGR